MTLKTPTARVLAGHSGPVFTLGWSVDGRRLASGSKDEGIRIWNPERADYGKASAELKGHTSRINQLRWDPTHPERLASAGEDGTLRFWDIRQGSKPIRTIENESKLSFLNLCWSPDSSVIAIGDSKDRLQFYDSVNGKKLGEHVEYSKSLNASEGQKDQINEVAFSHSGEYIFVPNGAGAVVTYEFKLEDGAVRLNQFNRCEAHACIINCIDIDPRGRYIAVGGADSIVSLIDLEDFYCVNTFAHLDSDVRTISFSYDGDFVAIAGKDFFIDISSVSTGQQVKKIDSLTYPVNTLAWHPSKYFLAYAGDEKAGNVRVVNLIE
ncbi:WD40-repeat-containing domain protein [Phakopsora pachyrhizi]|uniref:WD40-repeat-containing domain protein n=1 Tax=Phakopsora pachyrhizi TaxID=170000 RepID=A0AAV0AY61_PHAPC|nr:WD40-repeat-containing domain protein [Phakopsora pachyrhizi]CAH7674379.1 WD40-repeat-containing domain protein [Phakopsora pachyrhizi]